MPNLLINWFLFRWPKFVRFAAAIITLVLFVIVAGSSAIAGGLNPGQSTNALTVQGKAPGAASGLATLDVLSKVTQTAIKAESLTMQGEAVCTGSAITVTTSATTICTNTVTATAGDRLLAISSVQMVKGATAGDNIITHSCIGTCTGVSRLSSDVVMWPGAASGTTYMQTVSIYTFANTGTFQLRLYATSAGSNSTAAGLMGIVFLKKQ